jgi:hypothetical protein
MKELKFIHITKCAGTTIENLGKEKKIKWGMYHSKEYGHHHKPFKNKPLKLRKKYDWFMVVRNPYTRLVSEFYCKWGGYRGKHDKLNEQQFNNFIKNRVTLRNQNNRFHYVEQHKYYDKSSKIHIIKFENLEEEFNALMEKYGLDIKMDRHDNASKKERKFNIESFSPEVIKLINKAYSKDFKKFGYEMIEV